MGHRGLWLRRALVAMLLATGAICLPFLSHDVDAPIPSPAGGVTSLGGLSFATPLTGWSLGAYDNRRAILHTTDGGRKWRDVTPAAMRFMLTGPVGTTFLDGRHAWVSGHAGGRDDAVLATSNGGQTWRRTLVDVACVYPFAPYFAFTTFLNRRDGWLSAIDAGMHERIQCLYRTADGGASWRRIATNLPVSGILGFQTPRLGFGADVEGGAGLPAVYRTTDGGRTWQPYRLPLPAIYRHVRVVAGFPSPPLYGRGDTTLPAVIMPIDPGSHSSLIVYHSADKGRRWVAGSPLDLQSSGSDVDVSCANSLDCWTVTLRGLFQTSDAGMTWHKVATRTGLRSGMVLDVVTARVGFALVTGPYRQRLLRTADGGRTWLAVWTCYTGPRRTGCGMVG